MIAVDVKNLGMVSTNCYFVINTANMNTIIVDPADNFPAIKARIESKGYIPCGILLTHGHFDHVLAAGLLAKEYGIKIYAYESEQEIVGDPDKNLSTAFTAPFVLDIDEGLTDDQICHLGDMRFRVIHTPGHTIGSCCYYFEEEKILISGDTLFNVSVGRTDFPTGSTSAIVRSIREKLFVLPDDVEVYPGHGDATSIGYEKINNCIVQY